MRVLFVTYIDFALEIGGFQNQVRNIERSLKNDGIEVVWQDLEKNEMSSCDIVHIFSSVPSMYPVMKKAHALNKPIVLTPMIGSRRRSNVYLRLCQFLSVIPHVCTSLKEAYQTIKEADFWTPLSSFEANRLRTVYNIQNDRIRIIPNGIDDAFFKPASESVKLPFDKYVLIVGRIEPNKNQLNLIKAVNKLGLNLVIVGEPGISGHSYYKKCNDISGKNIFYWGKECNVEVLKVLYRQAMTTVIASYSEMVPLVVFESLKMGTPVVCTNRCSISSDVIKGVTFTGIGVGDLVVSIKHSLSVDRNDLDTSRVFSWDDVARQYEKVYSSVLDCN